MRILLTSTLLAATLTASLASAADIYRLKSGTPDLQSAGPLAFGPDGILLIGDNKGAAIFGIQTGDKTGNPASVDIQIAGLNAKLAQALGADSQAVQINDLAVNPASGNVYLALSVSNQPVIAKIDGQGQISRVPLKDIPFSKAVIPNAPEDKLVGPEGRQRNLRMSTITDLAFVDGQVIVSGMTNNTSAPTNVRSLNFPFDQVGSGSNLEIYHAAHARTEENAQIRTFVPFTIDGKPSLLAGFVCTPLVQFDLSALQGSEKVKGKTVAELGNRNQPLDMVVYKKDGQNWLLMANSARGVMKVSTKDIENNAGLTEPVRGGGTAGQPYETIASLQGVEQLDKLNDAMAVVLIKTGDGAYDLRTVPLP
uniref:ScyD/ScyE family protein n=1 Tax=Schlesneria paludicola TaxID=360056 RepID=A0A7C2K0D2_9PLAN